MNDGLPPTLGEFRVEAALGRGSIGQVYSGSHTTYKFPVTLVIVDAVHASSPGFRGRLVQFSEVITSLSHSNLAKVFKCGEQDGLTYIVMEAVTGGALKSAPASGTWTPASWAVVGLIKQAADGLVEAHAKGLVHGNLTLSNLLLTTPDIARAQVKVSEVGFLTLVGPSGAASTAGGATAGALEGPARDIAGLGALLELATGQGPAGGGVRPLPDAMPDDLKEVVLRCRSTDPAMKFTSCRDLAEALAMLLAQPRPDAYDAGPREPSVLLKTTAAVPVERKNLRPPQPPPPLKPGGPLVPCLHAFDQAHTPIDRQFLRASGLTIGREAANNAMALPSASVSAVHARIDWDARRVMITDLGSANGTLLQDHRLLPQVPQEWGPEQWVQVGPYWLWLQRPGGPVALEVTELVLDRDSRVMTLTPGKRAACQLTLVNQRHAVDHVKLSVEGIPAEWVELPSSGQQLNPSDTVELTIPINVPRSPASRANQYEVTFVGRSSLPDAKPGTTKATWTVLPFEASSISIAPPRAGGIRQGRFTVRLQNNGNDDASYVLTGADDDRQLSCLFAADGPTESASPRVDLEWSKEGARRDVRATVGSEKRWFGNTKALPFSVQARPAKGDQVLSASAQFSQRAVFPIWALAVLPLLVLALIFLMPPFFKPVMRTVSLDPRNPRPGERVEVIWDADGARAVQVLVDGLPVAETDRSQGRHVFSEGFEKDVVVRVVASNLFGSAPASAKEVPIKLRAAAPSPPAVIEMFEVTPRTAVAGQQVTIRWRTRGATKVDLQPLGTQDLEGSISITPTEDVSYTLIATNPANMTTTRTIPVRVGAPPIRLEFSASSKEARPDPQGLLVGVGQFVIFQWRAENAASVRINAVTPASLEGQSGQKTAQLRGEGTYTFTLVATDDKGQEIRSKPVQVRASCKGLPTRVITFSFGCNKNPELRWQ